MRRILVVDDDPHICLALRAWLKRYGFRVSIADGGVNGLAVLATATFDLMIVDIFMPNMRGFESIRVFHERAPTVPLIAISGHAFSGFDAASQMCIRDSVCTPRSSQLPSTGGIIVAYERIFDAFLEFTLVSIVTIISGH